MGFAVAIDAAMDDGDAYASSVDLSGGSVDMGCGEAVTRLELRGLGYRVSLLPMCDIVDTSKADDMEFAVLHVVDEFRHWSVSS